MKAPHCLAKCAKLRERIKRSKVNFRTPRGFRSKIWRFHCEFTRFLPKPQVIVLLGWGKKVCFPSSVVPDGRFGEDTVLLCVWHGRSFVVQFDCVMVLFVYFVFDLHLNFPSGRNKIENTRFKYIFQYCRSSYKRIPGKNSSSKSK